MATRSSPKVSLNGEQLDSAVFSCTRAPSAPTFTWFSRSVDLCDKWIKIKGSDVRTVRACFELPNRLRFHALAGFRYVNDRQIEDRRVADQ